MAAVKLAQRAGAEVFATAGSKWKRELLHEMGVTHVFDSRSASFADEVLARTGGCGVDLAQFPVRRVDRCQFPRACARRDLC